MEPIKLSAVGDTLRLVHEDSKTSNESKLQLGSYIGIHSCGGFIYLLPLLKTHCNVFVCKECFKREELPNEINTYGKLRDWYKQKIKLDELVEIHTTEHLKSLV